MANEYPVLIVDGEDRRWQPGSLTVNASINQRSSCDFTLVVPFGQTVIAERGTPVQVIDLNDVGEPVVVFNGVIERTERKAVVTPETAGIYIDVQCMDVHYFLDKRVVINAFNNQSAGKTVRDVVYGVFHEENLYDHPFPGTAITTARQDVLGYWRLAEDATDDSFWSNTQTQTDGTDVGSPTYSGVGGNNSPVRDFNLGGFVTLDGASDHINTGRGADALRLYGTGRGYTVSAWVYDDGGHSTWATVVSCGNDSSLGGDVDNLFSMRKQDEANGGEMRFWAYDTGNDPHFVADPTGVVPEGTWVHYAAVADHEGEELRLYRDGVLVDITAVPGGFRLDVSAGNPPVRIGVNPAADAHHWPGHLSEVLYVGRPFTHHEVGEHFRAASRSVLATVVQEATTVFWAMDETEGNLANDRSANGNAGTYQNSPTLGYVPALVPGGTAVDFDGTNQGLQTGNLNMQTGSFTISAWIRTDDAAAFPQSIASEDTGSPDNWGFNLGDPGAGELRFFFRSSSTLILDTTTAPISAGQVHHVACTFDINTGDRRIYVDGEVVASDTVDTTSFGGEHSADFVVGNRALLDWGFDGTIQHASAIPTVLSEGEIADIWLKGANYYHPDQPDVPLTRTATGTAVELVNFNYVDGGKVMEKLADVSEFEYFVDPYRTIHFHPRGGSCCRASFAIEDDAILVGSANLLLETPKYRNRQFIKGGKDRTAELIEVVSITEADQKAFLTGYPVAEMTKIEEDPDGNGYHEMTFGIRSGDGGDDDYYWSRGEVGITKDRDRPDFPSSPPADGAKVRITYTGLYPLVAISEDTDEVRSLLDVERAGTGKVEGIIEEGGIESRQQAFDLAAFQLARYAQRAETVQFTTRGAGLRPGQVVTVNLPRLNIDSFEALIESVDFDEYSGIEFRYTVKAVSGATLHSWHRFFSEATKAVLVPQERVNINKDEIATTATTTSDAVSITESPDPIERACVILTDPGPALPFTLC